MSLKSVMWMQRVMMCLLGFDVWDRIHPGDLSLSSGKNHPLICIGLEASSAGLCVLLSSGAR
jgi:hypothetical protein